MRAEEFMHHLDQDEINRIANDIGADIKFQTFSKAIDIFGEMDWIRISIQFLGVYSHIDVFLNECDYKLKDVTIDHIKRLIFSKLLDMYRDYLSNVFNFSK